MGSQQTALADLNDLLPRVICLTKEAFASHSREERLHTITLINLHIEELRWLVDVAEIKDDVV